MNFQVDNGEERDDQWKNAYFARYQSPNITIVPTVSFCHPSPGTEQIANPNTSTPTSPRLNCEQLTPVKDNIGNPSASPCRSNCDQQNLQVTSSNTSTSTELSDNFRDSLCVIQDNVSTEAPAFNMSQNIQDLPTSKYKSRNNLVDLTGFNLLKRERLSTSSLLKSKHLRHIDDTIEQDNMKTSYDENEHRNYSDSDSYKTGNISKESSTSEKLTSTHSEGNTESFANGEHKENKTDMEVKMKKYFRQLWKRKFDKLKDKAANEKHGGAIKSSSKTRQDYKDSKQESSRSKANLQKVSKSSSTKDLNNKIIDSSKNYRDLERTFMANYTERPKCETNSRHLPDSKVCIRDLKIDPDSIKRYKDFQRFRRHIDDHEIKYKSGNQIKTENLLRKKIRMKSCETTTNKPVIKKMVDERKQSIKTEKRNKANNNQTNLERVENTDMERAIGQSNKNRVKLIKSVVRVDKNVHNNLSQRKRDRSRTPPREQDLRSRLSRKRAKSEYFANCHELMENRHDQESHMITVKQDVKDDLKNSPILAPTVYKPKPKKCKQESIMITVEQDVKADSKNSRILAPTVNKPKPKKCKQESLMITATQDVKADSKNSPILAPTVNKPKPKKCKKIKLTINIECSNSDSDNSDQDFNECCSSPEDLRFLDDFNIDEIVDSLNNSQVELNKTIKTDNDYKNNEQTKPKKGLINNVNMKAIEMTKKQETSSFIGQVIEINSDTEDDDMNFEIGSVANTNKCKDEQNIEENSKVDRNTKQEANNITDLTANGYEIIDLCKDEQKIKMSSKVDRNTKQEANNITDLTGNGYEENAPKEIIDLCKDEHKIIMSSKVDRNTKQEANNITDLTGNGYEENAPKEIMDLCMDEQKIKMNSKVDRNTKQEVNNETDLNGKYCDKNVPKETINVSDASNYSVLEVIDITDENEHYMTSKHLQPKKPIQTSTLAKKVPSIHKKNKPSVNRRTGLENANKRPHSTLHEDKTPRITVKQKSDPPNITKKKQSQLHKSADPIEASLQIMFNIEQNKSVNSISVKRDVIKQLNALDKHVKEKNDNSHHSEDTVEASLEAMFNNYEQNGSIRKHMEQNNTNGCDRKAKAISIQKSVMEVSLESLFNGTKHQDTGIKMDIEQPSLSNQHIRKETDVLQTAQVMIKVPLETMSNEDETPRITFKQKLDPINITKKKQSQLQKSEDPIEASLQKMFNIEQNKSVNSICVQSDVIIQLNTLDKYIKEKNNNSHHSEDTVESSLEALFNNYEQNGSIRKHIEQNKINGFERKAKENSIQKSVVEVSLESIFNGTKHQDTGIKMDIEQPSLSGQHIRKETDVLQTAQVMIKVPLETVNNKVEQKQNLNEIKIELSNITDKHIIIESEPQEPVYQILPETTTNGIEMNAEMKINSEPLNVSDIIENRLRKSGSTSKKSLETEENILEKATNKKDIIPLCRSSKHVKKKLQTFEDTVNKPKDKPINNVEKKTSNVISSPPAKSELLFDSGNLTNRTLETAKSFAENCLTSPQIDIRPQNSVGQNNKPRDEPLQKSVETIKTSSIATVDNGEQKTNIRSESNNSVEEKALLPLENSEVRSEESPEKSNIQDKTNVTTNVELTVNKSKDKLINNIEKKTSNVISSPPSKSELLFDSGNSTNGTLETAQSFAENCLTSPQIDIRPQNSVGQNNKPKDEPLQKSVETIKTSSIATIDNGEQKTNIRSESNKSVEEKALLPLENLEVSSENVTTSVELTIPDKNIEVTSQKTSTCKAKKSLTANNKVSTLTSKKSNVENQTKSETVKNNTQKLETIDDALSDLNNVTLKDSELGKRSEIAINTKTKQEQVVSNKTLVPDGSKHKDEKISNEKAEIFTTGMKRFLTNLESRMSEYLQKKFTFSSIIHNGRFSTIYKCCGTKGDTYAVKVVRQRQIGKFMEGMLLILQQYRSRQNSFVLYLMSAFEVQNRWCLLTEYYPKNLKQALHEYTNGFHIDQVQILSRQLVDAVNMLTNAGIIHADIKPTHILLNNAHNKLKLCGFDRSNYSSCFNILLNNGTPFYRAPEVILGFQEAHGIDVWSTALVMFEMATNETLFKGGSNNEILYQQLCTFGSIDWSMLEQSRFRALYFSGTNFLREFCYKNSEKIFVVQCLHKKEILRRTLFQSYERQWARHRNKWQVARDMDKLESLHTLLEQMLVLNPRNRLPIEYVCASEFMIHKFI